MADFAVFTRNYSKHIVVSQSSAVFRSSVRWASPAKALEKGQHVDVYISVEGNGDVAFRARPARVMLSPEENDPEVKEMLAKCPESTEEEGLWDGGVKTLYELADIAKVETPFHFTELKRLQGGNNISSAYSRSYCLVQAID